MTTGDEYRKKAEQFDAWAQDEYDAKLKCRLEGLAQCYRHLAAQIEHGARGSSRFDILWSVSNV